MSPNSWLGLSLENKRSLRLEKQGKKTSKKGGEKRERERRSLSAGRRSIRLGKVDKEGGDIRR
jgi:hypothetical protein